MYLDFPGGASSKEPSCQCRRRERCGFCPWIKKVPWRREWQPTPISLLGESHGQRSLAGYSPWGCKELDMSEATQHMYIRISCLFCTRHCSSKSFTNMNSFDPRMNPMRQVLLLPFYRCGTEKLNELSKVPWLVIGPLWNWYSDPASTPLLSTHLLFACHSARHYLFKPHVPLNAPHPAPLPLCLHSCST